MADHEPTLSVVDRSAAGPPGAPRPRLILALRCADPLARPEARDLAELDEVALGRGEEMALAGRRLSWKLPDRWMSVDHAVLRRDGDDWIACDSGSKNGTLVNGRPERRRPLADGDVLELGQTFFVYRHGPAYPAAGVPAALLGMTSFSAAWASELELVARVMPSRVNVMLLGESGTGKEVLARAIHAGSGRSGPFVGVNCGAIPATLIEATLFGHVRGAYSGAVAASSGLIRSAEGGTLLLDEIGDLPAPAQAVFLRALQEREVLPVGAERPVKVDVRLISATHRDLETLTASGGFRADLLARLSGLTLRLPPLRERREDLGWLAGEMIRRSAPDPAGVSFSNTAARALFLHRWPLNVRELEKTIESAVALAGSGKIETAHLPPAVRDGQEPPPGDVEAQRRRLVALLEEHAGNLSAVARALGTSASQLRRLAQRHGLDLTRFRAG